MDTVAILFARSDSIYYQIPGCDVYDFDRNALSFSGGLPIVAHPPCRAWGRLSHFSKPREGERELAIWAVHQVREWGGVLEHPESSKLWKELNLPLGSKKDEYGGYTISIDQVWFGHKARKKIWLYVCGIPRSELPAHPIKFELPTHTINSCLRANNPRKLPEVTKAEREHTPMQLAKWLVSVAKLCIVEPITT